MSKRRLGKVNKSKKYVELEFPLKCISYAKLKFLFPTV